MSPGGATSSSSWALGAPGYYFGGQAGYDRLPVPFVLLTSPVRTIVAFSSRACIGSAGNRRPCSSVPDRMVSPWPER